ncbi:TSC22 domain family protein 2-like [Diretmus argenteus]
MSKMPAKKKSCFQITSVTQAQVAASSATDDTESLDDPDESRTEDVSSEIFDMSRADYEPVCDRSSSEETLNNVGETEAAGVVAPPHIPQVGQLSALSSNPNGGFRKVGVSASTQGSQQALGSGAGTSLTMITQPGGMQQQPTLAMGSGPTSVSVNASQPAPVTSATPSSTSTVSCSSRFRVIKLDHGTGEPFRRGRWTCTEFYEKDSEGSVVSRTVDSIRHANATVDPSTDRDSGLGHTGGSVVAPATHSGQGLGSMADAPLSASRMHSVETLPQQQQQQQQIHHQNYSAGQQGVSGTATQNTFSSSKPTAVTAQQQQQPTVGGLPPSAPQNLLPVGHNGLPQGGIHIQKSPIMPPAAHPQPVAYPPQQQQQILQQLPLGHHLTSQSSGMLQNQTEYYQQQSTSMQAGVTAGPSLPVASLSAGAQPVGQGPSPVMTPASGGASMPSQVGEMASVGGGSVHGGQTAPGLLLQQTGGGMGVIGVSMLVGGSTLQQQPQQTVGQYATSGQPQPYGLHPTPSGVQNVPAATVSSSVPTAVPSASSAATPNLTSSLPPGHHSQLPRSNTGVLGVQGFSATGFGQVEAGSGRKSEGLANIQPPVFSGKDLVKPLIPESLQLATPTVNSLFGIQIPVDGDEDRNPSKAFYQAFQSGSRLRDSKAHSDSASGTNVVAIDNKIEQAMDLVKSHLMYAVREEVEVLKEQIKELYERNSVLERENAVLKSLANSEQLSQLSSQSTGSSSTPPQQGLSQAQPLPQLPAPTQAQTQPPLQVQSQPPSHAPLQHLPNPQQLQTQPQLDPSQQLQPNVTSA